jgi:carbon starvation protein CstA
MFYIPNTWKGLCMLSVRHNGLSITEVIGIYLGKIPKQVMRVFTIVLMVLVGAVFISGPASILATLGVVAAPITSGDTAFRGARLIVSDLLKFDQKPIKNRLIITIPLFAFGFILTRIKFDVIWRYFAWSNQSLGTVVLWTITVYLLQKRKTE